MTLLHASISNTASETQAFQNVAELAPNFDEMMLRYGDDINFNLRVAMPAKVVSFDPVKQTIVAQPLIREKIVDRNDGSISWVEISQLQDVPVVFPQGGGYILTFPVVADMEVMLVFQDSCMDAWWAQGGTQNWTDRRRHDLSDAVAILGINSVPNTVQNSNSGHNHPLATDGTELRSVKGTSSIKLGTNTINVSTTENNSGNITLNYNGQTQCVLNNTSIQMSHGSTSLTGDSTGWVFNGNVTLNSGVFNINSSQTNINTHGTFFTTNALGALVSYSTHTHTTGTAGNPTGTNAWNPFLTQA